MEDLNRLYPINVIYSEEYPELEFTAKRFVPEVLRTKSKDWEYEQEVRIYKPQNGYHNFEPQSLRSVTFGCNTSEEKQSHNNRCHPKSLLGSCTFIQMYY